MEMLRQRLRNLLFFLFPIFAVHEVVFPAPSVGSGPVLIIDIIGPISPATDDYLRTTLKQAADEGARLLVVRLNTPGGLLTSTKSMVEQLLDSPVPTVIYIAPSGGSAVSAGVFITLAGHVAAMAPGTTIGAAHPVSGDGQDVTGDMREKIENFAVSLARAIAEQRGRNVAWAEKAVRESVSITDREALKEQVVDLVVGDLEQLLLELEGRTVQVRGVPRSLTGLASAQRQVIEMSFKQKVLNVLCDPNVAILLGLGAVVGIGIELYNPGGALPGIIGVICLILSLIAAQVLPINYGGAALVGLGVIFIVVEAFAPAFGMWGVAGIVCFVLGAIYLVDTGEVWSVEGFGVEPFFIGTVAIIAGHILLGAMVIAAGTRLRKVATGREALIHARGVVKKEFVSAGSKRGQEGKVQVLGELWSARLREGVDGEVSVLRVGDPIRVVSIDKGMVLVVEPDK